MVRHAWTVRSLILVVYVVMGAWLIISAVGRLVLQLLNEQPVDALPFITGGLGVVALGLVLPLHLARRRRERARPADRPRG
jgi:hypothetical protein